MSLNLVFILYNSWYLVRTVPQSWKHSQSQSQATDYLQTSYKGADSVGEECQKGTCHQIWCYGVNTWWGLAPKAGNTPRQLTTYKQATKELTQSVKNTKREHVTESGVYIITVNTWWGPVPKAGNTPRQLTTYKQATKELTQSVKNTKREHVTESSVYIITVNTWWGPVPKAGNTPRQLTTYKQAPKELTQSVKSAKREHIQAQVKQAALDPHSLLHCHLWVQIPWTKLPNIHSKKMSRSWQLLLCDYVKLLC